MKNAYKIIISIFPLLVWGNGCATQTDLQAEQKARETLRAQIASDNRASFDEIRREVQNVRGEVEEIRNRLDRTSKERIGTGPQIKLLEDRLAVVEKQLKARLEEYPQALGSTTRPDGGGSLPTDVIGAPSGAATPAPASSTPAPGTAALGSREEPGLSKESIEVQDEYRAGLRAFQDQQFDKAVQQFRLFQRKYPNSEMADDAQYWIGESYFSQKDYNRAILEFNDVLKYRKGDKVPAALLRQAQAFIEIGDKTDARLILQKLLNDHPNSEQARDAKERLQALR